MARDALHSQHNSGVLDPAIVVVEFRTCSTDSGLQDMPHQLGQPISCDDLGVVVQEADDVAGRLSYCSIVDGRVIEWPFVTNDCHAIVICSKEVEDRQAATRVIHDHELKVWVRREGEHAFDATLQKSAVSGWDQDADQRGGIGRSQNTRLWPDLGMRVTRPDRWVRAR